MKLQALFLLSAAFFVSCSTPAPIAPPKISPPGTSYLSGEPVAASMSELSSLFKSRGKVSGKTLDLQGNAISGKNIKHPKNRQDEKAIPLRLRIDGLTIKNGIFRDIPGGTVNEGDNVTVENCLFIEPGEDFISTPKDKAPGLRIINCKFYNIPEKDGGDKSIQLNDARNARIEKTYVTGGITAIRLQESTAAARNVKVTVKDCTFENVLTGVNVDGYTKVTESGNTFRNVAKPWVLGKNAKK